ncbi:hypothetical protein P8452_24929 [Trifolium repens]|nr:hypothetical protein P8452_24929 [Trifolium repens]
MSEKGPSATSNEQLQLEPLKRNIFSWDTTTPTIPLIDVIVDYSDHNRDEQITIPLANEYVDVENRHETSFRNDDYDQVLELWEIEPNDDFGCKGLNDRKSTFEEQYPNDDDLQNEREDLETTEDFGAETEVQELTRRKLSTRRMLNTTYIISKSSQDDDDSDEEITIPSPIAMIQHATQTALLKRPLATQYVVDDEDWDETGFRNYDYDVVLELPKFPNVYASKSERLHLFDELQNESDSETAKDFAAEVEVQETSQDTEISVEEGTTSNYDKTVRSSCLLCLKETEDESIEEDSTSETRNEPPMQLVAELKQKGIKFNVEDITTSLPTAKTITSSLEYGDGQIVIPFSISTIEEPLTIEDVDIEGSQEITQTNSQVSLNDDAFVKVNSNIEGQFPKDDEILVSRSRLSSTASQFSSMPSKDFDLYFHMESIYRQFQEETKGQINGNKNPSKHYNKEFVAWIEAEIASRHELVSSQEDGDSQIDMTSFSNTTETNDQDKNDVTMKVSSIVEQPSSKKDEVIVSKSRPSSIASQRPSKPSEEDSSQIVEDLSSSLLVKRELEQLVFKNHLAIENLPLLTGFLVTHPSVLLRDTSFSNRYKGYAYNCLSELLKFLKTHSVLDVLGSSHSEFVELLQDVRKCGFDKDWLDGVEKRALFPGLQVSQDALQKLLDSKHMLTQHVKDLKHQLASSETILESIIQQEALILETRAALSDPIGY